MELQIQTQELAPIQANLEQLKEYIGGVVAKYQNASYTDDQMKLAKADRADLKRLKEDIETKRKAVKARWNEPYVAFETEIKNITALIDEPVALIDGQIKDWEERRRQARRNLLEGVFGKWNKFGPLLPFESVLDAEMMKLSVADNKAASLLTRKLERIGQDMAQLESVISPEFRTECVHVYTQTLNLAEAIMRENILKAEKAKQEAVLGAAEPVAAEPEPELFPQAEPEEVDLFAEEPPAEPVESRRFVITGAPQAFNALRRWCAENGLRIHEVF